MLAAGCPHAWPVAGAISIFTLGTVSLRADWPRMEHTAEYLKKQALKARRLATDITDEQTKRALSDMANECEEEAAAIESGSGGLQPRGFGSAN